MACSGCAARREWLNKWTKVAYERARNLFTPDREAESEAGRSTGGLHPDDPVGRAAPERSGRDRSAS
ncbi:hypothetical protein EGJ51_07450 [Pseudomonas fulva]|nr:hypothetical protein EGJ51_07450 [Pseudomonas fulva]